MLQQQSLHFRSSWETWTDDHVLTKEARHYESQHWGLDSQNWAVVSRKAGSTNGKELKQDSACLNLEEARLIGNALLPGIHKHFNCNCLTGRKGKADCSTSLILPTAPVILLQLNMPRNCLYLLFPSSQGEEPAGFPSYFCFICSTKPFLTCPTYMMEEKHGEVETSLSVSSHQRRSWRRFAADRADWRSQTARRN